MMGDIIINFENITKFPLTNYLEKYRDFLVNDYSVIVSYFSGKIEGIDNSHILALKELTTESRKCLSQFKNFENRLSNCGYWELMEYLDNLNNLVEKINKLPKFLRTSLSKRGYTPTIQISAEVGGMRTIDDVSDTVNGFNNSDNSWVELMLNNDLNEDDWDIEKLSNINVYVNNLNRIVVTTIIDMPIGDRVYGKDILKKISFFDNDLKTVEKRDNIEQKCNILLNIKQGDIPENNRIGIDANLLAENIKSYSYSTIPSVIRNTFMQDDLFEDVYVSDISADNGDIVMKVNIKTKYDYQTEKKIKI